MAADSKFVKIAVQKESENPQLIKFNQDVDLIKIIEELCCGWALIDPDQYALKFFGENNENYVTERNRIEIKNGTVLILKSSPSKAARDIVQSLKSFSDGTMDKSKKRFFNLDALTKLCTDITFSQALIEENGLDILIDFIEKRKYQRSTMLVNALDSFLKIMKHEIVSWDILRAPFIYLIASFVSDPKIGVQDPKIVQYSFSILESVVLECDDKYGLIAKEVGFPKRLLHWLENENAITQENTLSLINAFFFKAKLDEQKTISATLFCNDNRFIFQNIIQTGEIGLEMAHQLYVTQTLHLGLLGERMNTKIDPHDKIVNDKFKELREIEFELEPISGGDPNRRHCGPFVLENKLGFTDEENPALDFTKTPPGMLAFDCMVYFVKNHNEDYSKVILENSCRTDNRECPIGRSSVEIVRVLCKRFKIGQSFCKHKTKYFQMFFSHEHPFYEMYCVCIKYMSKTWREMRATKEDFGKVLNVVMEQVACTMNSKPEPANFERLEQMLSKYTSYELNNLWRLESSISRENGEVHLQSEKKLIKPEMIQLIKEQRLNYMIEGTRFIKHDQRAQEKFWFVRLSKNHTLLHYGDCADDTSTPTTAELKDRIRITDIKSLVCGKDHLQVAKSTKKPQLIFSLNTVSEDEPINFIASNEIAYDYWTDGINALLGFEMTSKEAINDLDKLTSMEIKLRSLEAPKVSEDILQMKSPDLTYMA